MTTQTEQTLLLDHVDMRIVTGELNDAAPDRNTIVQLDPDHPGFRDAEYRARRNRIAQIAREYQLGEPIPDAPYTPEENKVWGTIWEALKPAHRKHACAEYLECVRRLDLPHERVPQLREVNERLKVLSGFQLQPVPGLVKSRVFFEALAHGVFMCTQYIRHHSTPLYTPEPDVAHELIGHAVWLASEPMAELNRLVGEAVKHTPSATGLKQIIRLYWFTIEFGVLRAADVMKAYGTGLLSSAGELEAMSQAELRPLDLDVVVQLDFDSTKYQPTLFYAESFEALYDTLREYLLSKS